MVSSLENLDQSLRESVQGDQQAERQRKEQLSKAAELQKMVWEQQQQRRSGQNNSTNDHKSTMIMTVPAAQSSSLATDHEGNHRDHGVVESDVVASVRAKELEIEKRKSQVQVKVRAHLSRLESQGRRLEELKRELEGLEDPTKKEVAEVRKKIECVDRDLKPLKHLCDRKEKELKEATQLFNEKNKHKNELVSRLMEIVTNSERQRMQKLDELNKQLEAMEISKSNMHH